MKKSLLMSLVLLSNLAMAKPIYRIINDGDDPKVVVKSDPNYVHPDLKEGDPGYSQETLRQMEEKLRALSTISMEDVVPAQLKIPDYTVAQNALSTKISEVTVNYFLTLEDIQKRMKQVFSELLALHDEVVKENDPDGLMAQEYERDLKIKIPKLNAEVNEIYKKALNDLYTLQSKANVPVKKKRSQSLNQVKNVLSIDFKQEILGICETRLCAMKIGSDLNAWFEFVQNFNRPLDFVKFDEAKAIWTPSTIKSSPFISIAMIDAAGKMIDMKLQKNKEYTIGGIIAKQVSNVAESTAGVVVAVASAPVYVMEKLGIAMAKLLTLKYIHLELALNTIETFETKVIKDSFSMEVREHSDTLKNSAIYVTEDDKKDEVEAVFISAVNRAILIVPTLVNHLSDEQLILVLSKVSNLSLVLANLNPARLATVKPSLPAETIARIESAQNGQEPTPGNPTPGNPTPGNPTPGNPTPGSPASTKFVKLLLSDVWLRNDNAAYRIRILRSGTTFQAHFESWNGGVDFTRPAKVLDNTAYIDYSSNNTFGMVLTQKSATSLNYSWNGGSNSVMYLHDTKNVKAVIDNLSKGPWLNNNNINYRISFKKEDPKNAYFESWNGGSPFKRPMIVMTDRIVIDYSLNNTYGMVLKITTDPKVLQYSWQGGTSSNMYQKSEF